MKSANVKPGLVSNSCASVQVQTCDVWDVLVHLLYALKSSQKEREADI